jgi:TatD DNase family protein
VFVDSHCHLCFEEFAGRTSELLDRMRNSGVVGVLNVCVTLEGFPAVLALAQAHSDVWASVGVHPDHRDVREPSVDELVRLAQQPRVVAIGETGLDYFRLREPLNWQRERFRTHIRAARETGLPLVVHTRAAAEDTLQIMVEERAGDVGGVMHCFTESLQVAVAAMEIGFHISFSGIVSFPKAEALRAVAASIPLERMLIETDAPYLAPVPHRGKVNEPAFVPHIAALIGAQRGLESEQVGEITARNFRRLFKV